MGSRGLPALGPSTSDLAAEIPTYPTLDEEQFHKVMRYVGGTHKFDLDLDAGQVERLVTLFYQHARRQGVRV